MSHRTASRAVAAAGVALILAGGVLAWHRSLQSGEIIRHVLVRQRMSVSSVTSCGVERWAVKTGTDSDATRVNRTQVVSDSIAHLRLPPAPLVLPARSRVAPTELTVFRISGYLLRIKQEDDGDFHMVMADGSGRTMIVEVPAPQCVGSSSLFLHQIETVRAQMTDRFHPTLYWDRGHWPMTVTGVGFFDFPHGQSGVAPNAIELHPVLAVSSGLSAPSPSPAPHPTPAPAGRVTVRVAVSPNPVKRGHRGTVTVTASSGTRCSASVLYSTGAKPRSFDGSARTIGRSGRVTWSWTVGSSGAGGTATVTCTSRGTSSTAAASFAIG